MTDVRSLLAFGPPISEPIPPGPSRFPRPPHGPSAKRQGERLTPQFAALSEALAAKRARTTAATEEQDPELVVVFELAGTVNDLHKAVSGIAGLEFLTELTEDEADPDEDFAIVKDGVPTGQLVPETLYTVMSNTRAAAELVRLFELWPTQPNAPFAPGLAPLKTAFAQLRAVRRWSPADRVRETGLLEAWCEDVAVVGGQGMFRVEIELWFRADERKRADAQAEVEQLVAEAGGAIIDTALLPGIRYQALLVDLPPNQIERIFAEGSEAIALLASDTVAFMAPAQPMGLPRLEPAEQTPTVTAAPPAEMRPRTALLDGMPLSNHATLAGRLLVDDPDDLADRYTSAQQHHGTAMASLICHGDLSSPGSPLSTRLYVRPVMEPHPQFDTETLVRDRLLVDLVHRCFHRMFEGDGAHPPSTPSVRIVNLSLGDPARVFVRRVSPLATLLDWLAHRYNLLILVSAGNHAAGPLISVESVSDVDAREASMLRALHGEARHRRLLSPAEAINAVAVGALHDDSSDSPTTDTVVDLIGRGMPASYSATGSGHRRSVKPDVLLPGGRQLFQRPLPDARGEVELSLARQTVLGPGLLVASPGAFGSDATAFSVGTSNATALATRTSHQIFDLLEELDAEADDFPFPDPQYHPVLAKALLVHAAGWGDLAVPLTDVLQLTRRGLTRVLGYGRVDPDRVASAARNRVVLLGAGSIGDKQRQRFSLPLPAALSSTKEWRRLTLTLAWLSPINPRSQLHRMAKVAFEPPTKAFGVARREADHNAAGKGTVQHEILEGNDALAFLAGDDVVVNVDCRIASGWPDSTIRFGLVASIEMATTVQADIHTQVRDGLRAQARSRTRVTPRS
ncbi:MAG: S8 family peptidase [Pseudonocardia sp.]